MLPAPKTKLTSAQAHEEMYSRLILEVEFDTDTYNQSFLDVVAKGKKEPNFYNQALRRLCTVKNDPKATSMIGIMMEYRIILGILPDAKNVDGLSAMDYALKNNPAGYALLVRIQNRQLEAIASQGVAPLLSAVALPAGISDQVPPCLQSTQPEPAMTATQSKVYQNTFAEVGAQLQRAFATMPSHPDDLTSFQQQLTAQLMATAAQARENMGIPQPTASTDQRSVLERLTAVAADANQFEPFVKLYEQEKYDQALRSLIKIKEDPYTTKIFDILCENKSTLPFNINAMRNTHEQTPLHEAALEENWQVYYCMTGIGADSSLVDNHHKSAADYRRARQVSSFGGANGNLLASLFASLNPTGAMLPPASTPSSSTSSQRRLFS